MFVESNLDWTGIQLNLYPILFGKEIKDPCGIICSRQIVLRGFLFLRDSKTVGKRKLSCYTGVAEQQVQSKGKKHATTEADTPRVTFQTHDRGDTWGLAMTASPVKQIRSWVGRIYPSLTQTCRTSKQMINS